MRDLQIQQSNVGRWFLMFIMMFVTVGPAMIFLVGGHAAIAGRSRREQAFHLIVAGLVEVVVELAHSEKVPRLGHRHQLVDLTA